MKNIASTIWGKSHDKKMIKVCYIITSLGKGGAERQLFELIKGINRNKFSPLVISLSEGGYWKEKIQALGIQTIGLRRKKNKEFSRLYKLIKLLRTTKADIVHTYMFSANTYGRIAAIILKVPIIISSERNISEKGKDKKGYEIIIDRFLAFFTHQIICNSFSCSSSLTKQYSIKKEKVVTIQNGIDISNYSFNRYGSQNLSIKTIGTVGRLEYQKNQKCFLAMAKIVLEKSNNMNLKFLIAGKGQLLSRLKVYAKELEIEKNVNFLGEVCQINELYKNLDIFVLTSHFEGLPNVVMEAMASSLPVVAVNVGGAQELIRENITGFLCSPDNAKELADKVDYLITNQKEAKEMGINGRDYIKNNFGINKMVQLTEETYKHLLKSK